MTPRASQNRIAVDDDNRIRVYVTSPPENGKANEAVCQLLAKALGLPKTALWVHAGHASREKSIAADGLQAEDAVDRLRALYGQPRLTDG